MKTILLLLLFGMFCILGCDSDTETPTDQNDPPADEGKTFRPGSGSTFMYKHTDLDSSGNEIPSRTIFITDSIGDIGLSFYGKDAVSEIFHNHSKGVTMLPNYLNYELNGDISERMSLSWTTTPFWVTYPLQSRQSKIFIPLDQQVITPGDTERNKLTLSLDYLGSGSMPIHDSIMHIQKFDITTAYSSVSKTDTFMYQRNVHYYYAPSVGMLAKIFSDPKADPSLSKAWERTLIDYKLKE